MRHYLIPSPDLLVAGTLKRAGVEWHVVLCIPAPGDEQVTAHLCPSHSQLERVDVVVHIATGLVLPVSSTEQPDAELLHAVGAMLGRSLLPALRRCLPIARGEANAR